MHMSMLYVDVRTKAFGGSSPTHHAHLVSPGPLNAYISWSDKVSSFQDKALCTGIWRHDHKIFPVGRGEGPGDG